MSNTLTVTCPKCSRPHALIFWQGKSGKRKLGIFCDRGLHHRKHKSGSVLVEGMEFVIIIFCDNAENKPTDKELATLPVYLTPEARKIAEQVGQNQLVLMNVKVGDTIERGAPIIEGDREAIQLAYHRAKFEDALKAEGLQKELAINLAKQKELDSTITGYVKARAIFENDEREIRRQLREVFTEPLKFTVD